MNQEVKDGRVPSEPGSRPTDQAPSGPAAPRFDPSRDETTLFVSDKDKELAWLDVDDVSLGRFCRWFIIKANQTGAERAEAEDLPMLALMAMHAGVALARFAHEANATTYTTELTTVSSASGKLGDWKITVRQTKPPRDSDGSGEAIETALAGSTEGDSAGRQASPTHSSHPGERA